MKRVLIAGAGPAGLTAAYELLRQGGGKYEVTVFEESSTVGGISRTVNYKGNRMDMGGHRLFSRIPEVNEWWENMLPLQGQPAWDDRQLGREVSVRPGGPDPETCDRVMLSRRRVSRIFFENKFYDYPLSLKPETFRNMGIRNTLLAGLSYMHSAIIKKPETNLENFYINRFGKKLYSMFFEDYTENLWGRHPGEIDASWGEQRVKGLSVGAVARDMFGRVFAGENRRVETSLIGQFKYPKLGPGQLWEVTAGEIRKMGGTVLNNAKVTRIRKNSDNVVTSVTYEKDGAEKTAVCDYFISSMPVKDLVGGMNDVPEEEAAIARGLPYRDYMTLGVLVPGLKLKNRTKQKAIPGTVPDCWVYVQDRQVKMGRFQIYNNWSPYMVKDAGNTVWLGLEYFVNEGDRFWNMTEEEFAETGISEMVRIGLIGKAGEVLDVHMEKVRKAYPAYFDTYKEMDRLAAYLSSIKNLYCVGRNGQHRYNNIDHSMCTSFEAVKNIITGREDKSSIWGVNTEKEYQERMK